MWNIGDLLKTKINEIFKNNQLDNYLQCIGYPCRSVITFNGNNMYDELSKYFQQELIRRGILWTAYHALSWSHKIDDIERTLNAFDEISLLFKDIIKRNAIKK